MKFSKERANAVAKVLEDKGISQSRITVKYLGDTVQPFSENDINRAVICAAD